MDRECFEYQPPTSAFTTCYTSASAARAEWKMRGFVAMTKLCLAGLTLGSVAAFAANTASSKPTFSKDVAKILFNRCAECHRAGEVAPMAFTSYQEIRPWAKAIKARVVARTMPPWLADPLHGP